MLLLYSFLVIFSFISNFLGIHKTFRRWRAQSLGFKNVSFNFSNNWREHRITLKAVKIAFFLIKLTRGYTNPSVAPLFRSNCLVKCNGKHCIILPTVFLTMGQNSYPLSRSIVSSQLKDLIHMHYSSKNPIFKGSWKNVKNLLLNKLITNQHQKWLVEFL